MVIKTGVYKPLPVWQGFPVSRPTMSTPTVPPTPEQLQAQFVAQFQQLARDLDCSPKSGAEFAANRRTIIQRTEDMMALLGSTKDNPDAFNAADVPFDIPRSIFDGVPNDVRALVFYTFLTITYGGTIQSLQAMVELTEKAARRLAESN